MVRVALTAFCSACQRTVYLPEGDSAVCPVCSTPLLEVVEASAGEPPDATGSPPHAEGL